MVKRVIGITISAFMLVAILVGCGGTTSNTATTTTATATETTAQAATDTPKEPVTLTLWVGSRELDATSKIQEDRFLAQYPYITLNKVVHEGDAGNDYFQGLAAGNAPDTIGVSYAMLPKYIKAGALLPLNDYIKDYADYSNFPKSEQDKFTTADGKIYALVVALGNVQLGYNKKLFAEAGITEAPKTWDDIRAYAKLLTVPSKHQAGYGLLTGEMTDWMFEYYVWQSGGDLVKNDNGKAVLTFTDPAAITAANFYKELIKAKVTQSDVTMKFGDLVKAFATGNIAMMPFAGDWYGWAVSLGAKPEDIGFALLPAGSSGQVGLGNSYGGGSIINPNSSKDKQDAAWEYIKFYASKEVAVEILKKNASSGVVNPVPIVRADVTYADAGITMDPTLEKFLNDSIKTSKPEYFGRATFGKYLDNAIQKIVLDPNSDPMKELQAAQDLATKEVLADFNK